MSPANGLHFGYKPKNVMKKTYALIALSVALSTGSCSEDNEQVVAPKTTRPFVDLDVAEIYKGTQSPGDVWKWALDKEQSHMMASWDHGTFDDTSDDINIEGTFQTLPSGFLKVKITKAVPASEEIPTDGTAWFYAMEIPGMAMVIKPEGSIKGDVIALVPQGDCADVPGIYNYIVSAPGEHSAYNPITDEAFGYLEVSNSGSDFAITGYKWSLDCVNGGKCSETGIISGFPKATCKGGGDVVITDGGKTAASGQFTGGGTMMMDFGYGNGGAFALKASENATKSALLNNNYFGIAYMPKNENNKTVPVKLDFSENDLGNMIGTGNPYTNIETNEVNNDEGAVVLVENVVNGRVFGSMNFDNDVDASSMGAALLVNGNDQILILTSYDEEKLNPFILILAKKN
jgi:hypothetical protein